MRHRAYLKTPKYIGVDLDGERIDRGMKKHPDAVGIVSSIEDFDHKVKGDVVLCIETIGINDWFEVDNTMLVIRKAVCAVEPDGTLIFNVGGGAVTGYESAIDNLLRDSFCSVDKREYGAFHGRTSSLLSYSIAKLMLWFPALRSGAAKKIYYLCRDRRPVSAT
jgi:hypothetical protein